MRLIDLSQELCVGMPVYPGSIKTQIFTWHEYESLKEATDGALASKTLGLLICDHAGTHVDSFSHIDEAPGVPSIEVIPLERFYTPAVCLDLTFVDPPRNIAVDDLKKSLRNGGLRIESGDTVLIYTGNAARHLNEPDYLFKYSGLTGEAVQWLADQGVGNIGIDAPSLDGSSELTPPRRYPAHQALRDRKILNMEGLGDLGPVAGKRFTFIGFPLRIRGGTGSPIRAAALLPD